MRLTLKNYYTINSEYITSSKLKDWSDDKKVFFDKHVLHRYSKKNNNPAFVYGALMDYALSDRPNLFNECKHLVGYNVLLGIEETARRVRKTKTFRDFMKTEPVSQIILSHKKKIGIFKGLAGIPDWYKINKNVCMITDLKTTAASNHIEYYYHCDRYKYYLQQAFYQMLIELIYEKEFLFFSQHLVVYKRYKGRRVEMIKLEQSKIDKEKEKIKKYLCEISKETKFGRYATTWSFTNTKKK
mgnify:CR=1 FL=1